MSIVSRIVSIVSIGNKSNYKGNKVGYWGLHRWLDKELGRPRKCEHCGTIKAKRYEWANISGEYKRDTKDFIRLCQKCHKIFDKDRKGLTIQLIKNWDAQRL